MSLAISDDHQQLADVVRQFAEAHQMIAAARALVDDPDTGDRGLLAEAGKMGWLGLHVGEKLGGSGYSLEEAAVVADELGRQLGPVPALTAMVAAGLVAATEPVAGLPLDAILSGASVVSLALAGTLAQDAEGIHGRVSAALCARWADLVVARLGEDVVIFDAHDLAVRFEHPAGLDPAMGLGELTVEHLLPPRVTVVPGGAALARRLLRTLAAAYAAGGARAALDLATEYAKVREQFGRTIGSFQAVKHHLANMLVAAELATACAWDGARADAARHQADFSAAAAATSALDAFQRNAQTAIQVLGGIGFTWEHDAHLYLRRAVALKRSVFAAEDPRTDLYALSRDGVRRESAVELPPEAEAGREPARAFLARYRGTPDPERRRLLAESGYLVPHWPPPYGRGATPAEQLVLDQELRDVDYPRLGIAGWVMLTLTQTATPSQVERWIPAGLAGELDWCQLFSEPNAGSDAAAVRTRGVRVDGGWRVTGQKVWTSNAHNADLGLATIRTDPDRPKHKGITTVAIDLHAPGVTIRPRREATGDAMFNEVFFDDVFVPDADVIGEVNGGWNVARATLGNERVTIGGGSREGYSAYELLDLAERYGHADSRRVAELITEEHGMAMLNLRRIVRAVSGAAAGPEGNVTKLLSAEHEQRVTEAGVDLAGIAAVTGAEPKLTFEYLLARSLSIAGGTSEITRNVIAERILGMPRDPLTR
jgi:3-oxochol-4-en-24-oyl-CoA dehydrogenase